MYQNQSILDQLFFCVKMGNLEAANRIIGVLSHILFFGDGLLSTIADRPVGFKWKTRTLKGVRNTNISLVFSN